MSDAVNWRMRKPIGAAGAFGDTAWTGGLWKRGPFSNVWRRCLPVVISQLSVQEPCPPTLKAGPPFILNAAVVHGLPQSSGLRYS